MFFVKFGDRPHDPIWAIDVLESQREDAATVFGYRAQYSCGQVSRPRSTASSMTFCMYMPRSAHCGGPSLRSRQKNRPTGAPKNSPFFNDFGLLKIYRIAGTDLVPVSEAKIGHWCQGIVWSKDSKTVLVQCMVENEITPFTFDGKTLTKTAPIAMKVSPAGIRTAEP